MVRTFVLFILVFGSLSGTTQVVGDRVNQYRTKHAIDTFLVYSLPCTGGVWLDTCDFEDPHYLFWKHNGQYFLKRFDFCKTYQTLSLDTTNPLSYYLANRSRIDKEEIRSPLYYELRRHKDTVDSIAYTLTQNHSCYHKFQFPFTKIGTYKYAGTFDLDLKYFDNGKLNLNYRYNQDTKLKVLITMTTSLIKNYIKYKGFQEE